MFMIKLLVAQTWTATVYVLLFIYCIIECAYLVL